MKQTDKGNEVAAVSGWSAEEIKRFGYRVVDLIADHVTGLPDRSVFRPFPEELAKKYLDGAALPEAGQSAGEVLAAFAADIEPFPFGNGHPRFHGWVNSPPTAIGIFAEALAAAMNPSCAGGNHAAIYVERQAINWFKQMVGFPPDGMGLLVSGGSMATLTALAVARHLKGGVDMRAKGVRASQGRMIVYKTAEGHGCIQKAVELLGLGSESLRMVKHDAALRMIPSALESAIRADVQAGDIPIAVAASAGTVNTGAIDPLNEIADLCARHDVWLHVDGAYGAPAILTGKYKADLAGLARCDSLALDPHKWMYVPVEAGLVLVRNGEAMRAAFSLVPPYLRTDGSLTGVGGLPWFSEYGFQQTRGFRALKVWMAMKHHGLAGYRAAIERDISLAERLAEAVRRSPDLELREPQSLSIVCFRYSPAEARANPLVLDQLNKVLLERIQLGGEAFLSSTVIDDAFWLRACIVNHRTAPADIDLLIGLTRSLGAQCLKGMRP